MGFATYGRAFRLATQDSQVGAPASGSAGPGQYTREAGFWAFYEVKYQLRNNTLNLDNNNFS